MKGEYMQIANPIYDVVFKYLMEDSKVAKLIISSIINETIVSLEIRPQEFISHPEDDYIKTWEGKDLRHFTVYKLDFSAKIKTETGFKLVIIEIQKAKYPSDIMRFRKYLGEQYANKENFYSIIENNKEIRKALPIISIYFLGHNLDKISGIPVIKTERKYIDVSTGNIISEKEDFIESLTHDSYVIQIPALKEKRRNELEILLSVFDQSNRTSDNHILNVKQEDFPDIHRDIIRRLQKAVIDKEMRKKMDLEDTMLEDLENMVRAIERQAQLIEENVHSIEEKEKAIQEKEKAIQEKDKAIEEKEKTIEEKEKAIQEKDKAIEEKEKTIEEKEKTIEEKEKTIEENSLQLENMKKYIEQLEKDLKK
jgi:hypothetical protein